MSDTSAIKINVDLCNPGQFFACCGLLELADRLWPGAEGWFENHAFFVNGTGGNEALFASIATAGLHQIGESDDLSPALQLGEPFGLRLDWWRDELTGGKNLKVWAGTMQAARIARAMKSGFSPQVLHNPDILNHTSVVYDAEKPGEKVEPFYFDARRAPNAHSRDVGFAPNDLKLKTTAAPAVEFLCLVGLQRFRPAPTDQRRVFDYYTWSSPAGITIAPAIACGQIPMLCGARYRFENWFRTGQRKHKAFYPATLLETNR